MGGAEVSCEIEQPHDGGLTGQSSLKLYIHTYIYIYFVTCIYVYIRLYIYNIKHYQTDSIWIKLVWVSWEYHRNFRNANKCVILTQCTAEWEKYLLKMLSILQLLKAEYRTQPIDFTPPYFSSVHLNDLWRPDDTLCSKQHWYLRNQLTAHSVCLIQCWL
jgi:hypothetical protein